MRSLTLHLPRTHTPTHHQIHTKLYRLRPLTDQYQVLHYHTQSLPPRGWWADRLEQVWLRFQTCREEEAQWHCLLGGGGALQAAISSQGPVLPSGGPERALPVFTTNLHLEHFLVALLVLIGWQVHTWMGSDGREEGLVKIQASGSDMSPTHMWRL